MLKLLKVSKGYFIFDPSSSVPVCVILMVMEPKLSHRQGVLSLPNQTTTFPSHSFTFKLHFRDFAKKWRIHLHEVANGQNSSYKHLLVHAVKEGETLTSISKQYGVSAYSIAAVNKNILDVDLIFEGQKLYIPSSVREELQVTAKTVLSSFDLKEIHQRSLNIFDGLMDKNYISMQIAHGLPHTWKNRLSSFDLKEIQQRSLNIFDRLLDKQYFTLQITRGLPHAKTTGYFLVLVPLIAYCISCMIGAIRTRKAGGSGRQVVNGSKGHHHESKTVRWKSALRDIIEGDVDSDSRPQTNDPVEDQDQDQAQVSFEESSHAYRKLEHDYEKFLSECGMSKWGYWRGGSPE